MTEQVQLDIEKDAIAAAPVVSTFLDGRVTLYGGDCLDVMASLPENSVDSVVCDPPYHLTSIVKRFGKTSLDGEGTNEKPAKAGADGMARLSRGFMGQTWDGGDVAFRPETWELVFRVLKPGGHLIAFSGTRTYHRMACAIEDAGFEVRDMIAWHYGSGFPKSHNVGKAIDKAAGAEREVIERRAITGSLAAMSAQSATHPSGNKENYWSGNILGGAVTEAAKQWDGWGTALKPATEPMCLARKPLDGTVAENVMKWGVGALNIDACRVAMDENLNGGAYAAVGGRDVSNSLHAGTGMNVAGKTTGKQFEQPVGRWPANLMHDGSPEVVAMFPDETGGGSATQRGPRREGSGWDRACNDTHDAIKQAYDDPGSAARFFWSSKAAADDRLGSKHPTVKPIDLMQELVRLVTPKGGTVLDPFAGTGTTGEAAWREGMKAILIEREPEYRADIARRMELATQPTKRAAVAKTKNKIENADDMPLFGGI